MVSRLRRRGVDSFRREEVRRLIDKLSSILADARFIVNDLVDGEDEGIFNLSEGQVDRLVRIDKELDNVINLVRELSDLP